MKPNEKPPIDFPETLYDYLQDEDPGAHPEIVYRRRHAQGVLTASVHGSHVQVTVSLRRRWALLRDVCGELLLSDLLVRCVESAGFWVKAAVVAAALYLVFSVGAAFLPGGAVERILGSAR